MLIKREFNPSLRSCLCALILHEFSFLLPILLLLHHDRQCTRHRASSVLLYRALFARKSASLIWEIVLQLGDDRPPLPGFRFNSVGRHSSASRHKINFDNLRQRQTALRDRNERPSVQSTAQASWAGWISQCTAYPGKNRARTQIVAHNACNTIREARAKKTAGHFHFWGANMKAKVLEWVEGCAIPLRTLDSATAASHSVFRGILSRGDARRAGALQHAHGSQKRKKEGGGESSFSSLSLPRSAHIVPLHSWFLHIRARQGKHDPPTCTAEDERRRELHGLMVGVQTE